MQQIYLGWDIMDEYHNIIDHYQGYYYLHSLFQNTAQVKTFQSENSSCFDFSNPAKREDWRTKVGKKSKRNICKTWIIGGSYSLLRHIFEMRFGNTKNKMWEALAFQRGEEKVWKGVGNIKRYWTIQKILEDIEVVGQGLCWVGGEAKVNFGPGCQAGNLEKTTLKVTR